MEFITRNTPIPVPKIHCAFKRKGCTYIVMERVRGESIVYGWMSRSAESKAKIIQQLKEMVESMRRIPPPSEAVSNVDGGRLWDCRLAGKTYDFGPFDNINTFHQHLRGGIDTVSERLPATVNELIQLHGREWPAPVLTHGNLSSLNIMAEGDTITSIVDWETAGWYPCYWEYTTACQVTIREPFWREEVDKFLDPCPQELRMEGLRQAHFGDV